MGCEDLDVRGVEVGGGVGKESTNNCQMQTSAMGPKDIQCILYIYHEWLIPFQRQFPWSGPRLCLNF